MFGFFKKQPMDIGSVIETMGRRHYAFKVIPDRNIIVVKGKYRNNGRDFKSLYLHFVGDNVEMKDSRGNAVTHIPPVIPVKGMYPYIMNVLGMVQGKSSES